MEDTSRNVKSQRLEKKNLQRYLLGGEKSSSLVIKKRSFIKTFVISIIAKCRGLYLGDPYTMTIFKQSNYAAITRLASFFSPLPFGKILLIVPESLNSILVD